MKRFGFLRVLCASAFVPQRPGVGGPVAGIGGILMATDGAVVARVAGPEPGDRHKRIRSRRESTAV